MPSKEYAMADKKKPVTSRELGLQCNDSITMYHWKITRSSPIDFHGIEENQMFLWSSQIDLRFVTVFSQISGNRRVFLGCFFSMVFPAKHPKPWGSSTFCVPLRCSSWSPLNAPEPEPKSDRASWQGYHWYDYFRTPKGFMDISILNHSFP